MIETVLDKRFEEAVAAASKMTQASLPQDVQLRLYAFYKQATGNTGRSPTVVRVISTLSQKSDQPHF